MKIDARGSKKEPHRSKIGPPGGPLESSWGVLGAESASEERSGRKRGVSKKLWRALGTTLGSSWRVLGPFWVAFPPPWGVPGGHFWTFLGRPSRDLKNELLFVVFSHTWSLFSVLLFALCCLPCSVAGSVVHMQKIENSLVFVGRKPYAPFFRQRPKQSNFRGHA